MHVFGSLLPRGDRSKAMSCMAEGETFRWIAMVIDLLPRRTSAVGRQRIAAATLLNV